MYTFKMDNVELCVMLSLEIVNGLDLYMDTFKTGFVGILCELCVIYVELRIVDNLDIGRYFQIVQFCVIYMQCYVALENLGRFGSCCYYYIN